MQEAATTQAMGITNFATGDFTGDGTITDVNLGFVPRHIRIVNETDVIVWEKFSSQAAANCVKTVTAGTTTLDATSAITLEGDTAGETFRGFRLSAALAASGKVIRWAAWG